METGQRVKKVFDDSFAQVSAILTPDQRVKLDQIQKERREMMKNRWQEGHWHGGGPHDAEPQGSPSPGGSPTAL